MSENSVTVVGNITRDPELKFLDNGDAVVRFSVAHNRRWQNPRTQEREEKTAFLEVTAYKDLAANVAASLSKGYRVIVTGRLDQRSWEGKDGEKRSTTEIVADAIGPDLRFVTVGEFHRSNVPDTPNSPHPVKHTVDDDPF